MTVIASGEIDLKLSKQSQAALENDLAKAGNTAGKKSGSEFDKGFTGEAGKIKKSMSDTFKDIGRVAGPALLAVGGALTKLSQSQEKATINLRRAVENTGASFKDFGRDLGGAEKQQAKFGNNSIDTTRALTTLTQKLQDPKKALEALSLASDLAAAKSISLEAATGLVTKAYSGNAKVLATFGINIKDSKAAIADATAAQEAAATAVTKLSDAQQNLSDLEAVQAEKKKLTIADEFRLRDAKQAVADAQANVNTTAQLSLDAQAKSQGAIKGTEEAVGRLRGQVQGLAEEQSKTLEGRLKGLGTQIQNVAIDAGGKLGPAITAVSTATTIAANLIALKLSPALLGAAGAYGAAALAGVGLGLVLNQLIEAHAPGVNRALESVGAKLFDFGQSLVGTQQKYGLLSEAQDIFGLSGEKTKAKVDGQIRALHALAAEAIGPTRTAILKLIESLEAIHPEYRTKVVADVDFALVRIQNLQAAVDRVSSGSKGVASGGGQRRHSGGPVGAGDYFVGERGNGGEFLHLNPGSSGYVTGAHRSQQILNDNRTSSQNITVIDNTGDPRATAFAVSARLGERSQR